MSATAPFGTPRLHLRLTDSTNTRARALAAAGAPHGTLVTAAEQSAGRGRQGRTWSAPAGQSLLSSVVVRDPPPLVSLLAGVAAAEAVGPEAQLKWPNDVYVARRKVAGILVEGRPQEAWGIIGVGVNVAIAPGAFPAELADRAGTLGLGPDAIEPLLARLLEALERWLAAPAEKILGAVRARDALLGQTVTWAGGTARGAGIDELGRLIVDTGGGRQALNAGEVHLRTDLASGIRPKGGATVDR
ncbi:MAG TPA: biotin--[acetyl-CoA-carboxylase] ligase [Solirubrobacteraceae bacterium]|jgi:BirA family biotin operon repressor/biotin-[acetyl-CoA-carboxylase] ligase|nr:biotin--[acetyl-CoA-carboxylase] ligase [Solirubrobacteraceae bacterium]